MHKIIVRRDLLQGYSNHCTLRRLRVVIERFDKTLIFVQRVKTRFDGYKKSNALSIKIKKAKTLWGIYNTLTGIYDTLRYMVSSPMQHV